MANDLFPRPSPGCPIEPNDGPAGRVLVAMVVAIVCLVAPSQFLAAQGMAVGRTRALSPISLPKDTLPPRVSFKDVAGIAGLARQPVVGPLDAMTYLPETTGTGVALVDYNNDGLVDIFLVGQSSFQNPESGQPHLLYRNLGNLEFERAGSEAGIGRRDAWAQGVCAGDFDADGYTDLFVTRWGQSALLRNVEGSHFRDETAQRGLQTGEHRWSTGCSFLDYDRDGWPDIFAANGHVAPSVDSASGDESFAQPRLLFWNRGDGIFYPLSGEAGPGITDRHPSRGSAIADLDNDGDVEIVVVNLGGSPSLLQNQVEPAGNWLTVRAVSPVGSDRIGARVTVTSGDRVQVGEVRSGSSYLSQGDFRLHFGLGNARSATVRVTWPSEKPATEQEVSANQFVTIREPAETRP